MKKQFLLYSISSVVIFFVIIILVNLIAANIFVRFDMTQGQVYSLSKASKKIISKLPDKLIVKAYFSKNLPAQYAVNKKYLQDLLGEYKVYSRGKIKHEFIDPTVEGKKKESLFNEMASLGITPLRFTQIEKDKYEVQEGYMGAVFIYGDKKEVIPVVKSIQGIEYDITSIIKKLISPEIKSIGFTSGHGEPDSYGELDQYIRKQYNMRMINTTTEKSIPDDISSLLVVGPKNKFADKELLMIDQFLLKGKPVAFFIDSNNVDMRSFYANPIDTGIGPLLEKYGIKILPEFVLDMQCKPIQMRSQYGYFMMTNVINYVLYPVSTNFDKKNVLVKDLDNLGMLFSSPIEIIPNENVDVTPIAKSSDKSWSKNTLRVNPYDDFKPAKTDKNGPFNLAVLVNPKKDKVFTSYFADKSPKELTDITNSTSTIKESKSLGRMVVISNSTVSKNEGIFFLNLIDWLSHDEDLISIRSKGEAYRPLKQVPAGIRLIFKYTAILLPPLLVILYGIYRWKSRTKFKKSLKELYA